MFFQGSQIFRCNLFYLFPHTRSEHFHESPDIQFDIFYPFTQRRELNPKNRQAVIQIFTEMPGLDLFLKVSVRSGYDSDIYFNRTGIPHFYELATFQYP